MAADVLGYSDVIVLRGEIEIGTGGYRRDRRSSTFARPFVGRVSASELARPIYHGRGVVGEMAGPAVWSLPGSRIMRSGLSRFNDDTVTSTRCQRSMWRGPRPMARSSRLLSEILHLVG